MFEMLVSYPSRWFLLSIFGFYDDHLVISVSKLHTTEKYRNINILPKRRSPCTWPSPCCRTSKGGAAFKIGTWVFHLFPVPQEPPSAIGLTGRLREVVNPNMTYFCLVFQLFHLISLLLLLCISISIPGGQLYGQVCSSHPLFPSTFPHPPSPHGRHGRLPRPLEGCAPELVNQLFICAHS